MKSIDHATQYDIENECALRNLQVKVKLGIKYEMCGEFIPF
jgi:hypothetical protein